MLGLRVSPLLRSNRDFRRFFAGQAISLVGDQITMIALPLVAVLALDATPVQMGYLVAAVQLPSLLFGLHAGAWVDRRGQRRKTMIAADLGRTVVLLSLPVAYAFGRLTLGHLYAVAFAMGTCTVLFLVSHSTLFVTLVPREQYVSANALLNGSRALSFVVGPSIGGLLVQILSAPVALVADALSFLVSALALGAIAPPEPPTETAERGHLAAGARYILRSPVTRASLLSTATINFFNFVFWALFILYVTRSLHVGPETLGVVLGLASTGGVLGSVLTGRIQQRIGIGPAFVLGCMLFPLPLVLVPLAGGPRPVVLGCLLLAEFGSGFGVMLLDITAGAIRAALTPDRLRARVSGAYMAVNYGVRPVGSLVGGALGSWLGLRPTLWIATIGALGGCLWLLPSPIAKLRALPEQEE